MNAITPSLDHLARVLGMLGSAHDGEVVNAARVAEKMRRELGLQWAEILTGQTPACPHILRWPDDVLARNVLSLRG
jgi:hypothetical protein